MRGWRLEMPSHALSCSRVPAAMVQPSVCRVLSHLTDNKTLPSPLLIVRAVFCGEFARGANERRLEVGAPHRISDDSPGTQPRVLDTSTPLRFYRRIEHLTIDAMGR